jgi:aspartyl-tRNA(Asn)/glutamyl-tRNA(Gln) amidotransferase subunit B
MTKYETVIGLEIHAELLTKSKMFCSCRVVDSVEAPPNSAVCPVCLGMPGMLPVINKRAIEYAMRVGLALHCTIQKHNVFARKNYFYPDLPKAYQISQYELPLATGGYLDIEYDADQVKRIGITRVHMEEDTGKLTHTENGEGSLVDFNRSGVPLLEIVSEPDLRSVKEARAFATKVRQVLRYLNVNSGDMEKGVIRFEANISIRPMGETELGTRTEIKNLNSFRAMTDSIEYEVLRQTAVLDAGKKVVQDTMGWSESRRKTFSQRGKEEAHDYRYFPEPDLPPLSIEESWIDEIREQLPELPDAKVERYTKELGLSGYEARVLADDRLVAEWFELAVGSGGDARAVSNWMTNVLFSLMNEQKEEISDIKVSPKDLVALITLIDDGVINSTTAKEVLSNMFLTGQSASKIVEDRGLAQISGEAEISAIIAQLLKDNPKQVGAYLDGKESLRGWFVGQVMRTTRGKANPGVVNRVLSVELDKLKTDGS